MLATLSTVLTAAPVVFADRPHANISVKSKIDEHAQVLSISEAQFKGIKRTHEKWLRHFLGLEQMPIGISREDIASMRLRLLTTGVFYNVVVSSEEIAPNSNQYRLIIELDETWTMIPVVRAAYGGGVPLKVVGIYDLHSFGRLLTLGAEGRQYGQEPWSFVAWAKSPQFWRGKFDTGLELWHLLRRRDLYTRKLEIEQSFRQKEDMARLYLFRSIFDDGAKLSKFQIGMELQYKIKSYALWANDPVLANNNADSSTATDSSIQLNDENNHRELQILPGLIYDNVIRYQSDFDGLRLVAKSGISRNQFQAANKSEIDFYYYDIMPWSLNTAYHLFVGQNNLDDALNLYYLGGLDSVRGLPEGALAGRKAVYSNLEVRYVGWKFDNIWLQGVAFADYGSAGEDWQGLESLGRSSGGFGMRLIVPYVSRLVFRIDYAKSFNDDSYGISAGMNQFFDPFKPL